MEKNEADSFQNIIGFTTDIIDTNKIYPLHDLLQQMREYFNEGKKNNTLKNSIQQKIAQVIIEDTELIDRLRSEITQFSQSLTTKKIVL